MKKSVVISLIFLGVIVIAGASYAFVRLIQRPKQSTNQAQNQMVGIGAQTDQAPVGESGWQTYTDSVFGYTIQYPVDWTQGSGSNYQVRFSPTTPVNASDASVGDIVYFYQGDIWIDVFENPDAKSVDAIVREQVRDPLQTETVSVGGKPMTFYRDFCPSRIAGPPTFGIFLYPFCQGSVLIPQAGYVIALQYGPTGGRNTRSTFDRMLGTLQIPTDPTAAWTTETNSRIGYRFKHPASWKWSRQTDANYGIIAQDSGVGDGGAFVVYNNGGAQRKIPESGYAEGKPTGSTVPAVTIDGVPAEGMKIEFWDHRAGIDPVPGSPGPGFYRATLELDYTPQSNSRLPVTWGSPSWISVYPDANEELTVPRMILRTFQFDSSLVTSASPIICKPTTDRQRFDQADQMIVGQVDFTSPEMTRFSVLQWFKTSIPAGVRPQVQYVIPAFTLTKPNDFVFKEGSSYLLYLKDEQRDPKQYSASMCSGTREYTGTLTPSEQTVLSPL